MPDIATHYALSLLVASRAIRLRYALPLALAGLLPDLDSLLRVHRSFTHSLLIAAPVVCIATALALAIDRGLIRYVATASALYVLHIVFDLFTAPTPILWPLADCSLMVSIAVDGAVTVSGVSVVPSISVVGSVADFTPRHAVEGPILTSVGVITAIAVAAVLAVEHIAASRKA